MHDTFMMYLWYIYDAFRIDRWYINDALIWSVNENDSITVDTINQISSAITYKIVNDQFTWRLLLFRLFININVDF